MLNFLHYGGALELLPLLLRCLADLRPVRKEELLGALRKPGGLTRAEEDLADVILAFGGRGKRMVEPARLMRAASESMLWRPRFAALRCRGFSFELLGGSGLRLSLATLKRQVRVRTALVTTSCLYYPPKVRSGLTKFSRELSHIGGGIGWILGLEQDVPGQKWWIILNIQSDLTSAGPSCVRDTFAGWQRVLFLLTARLAVANGVTHIALPPAARVAETRSDFASRKTAPEMWRCIYDGTAAFFSMRPSSVPFRVDLQTVHQFRPVWCSDFFVGDPGSICSAARTANLAL
jgi:hypothetical protein